METKPSLDRGAFERMIKMFYSHAAKAPPNLVTTKTLKVDQSYVSYEAVLAVFRCNYIPSRSVPSLKSYNEQRSIIQNIPVWETTIQLDFICKKFRSNEAMKNNFVVMGRRAKNRLVL